MGRGGPGQIYVILGLPEEGQREVIWKQFCFLPLFVLARVPIFKVSKQRTTNRQSHHNTSLCLHFQLSGSWSYSVHTERVLVYTRPSAIRRTETVNTSWYFGVIALIWRCVRSRGGRWIMDPELPCFCQFKSCCLRSSCFSNLNNPAMLKKWRPTWKNSRDYSGELSSQEHSGSCLPWNL